MQSFSNARTILIVMNNGNVLEATVVNQEGCSVARLCRAPGVLAPGPGD